MCFYGLHSLLLQRVEKKSLLLQYAKSVLLPEMPNIAADVCVLL